MTESPKNSVKVRNLGLADYLETWQKMQAFTLARDASTENEIWCVEHPPVFTQGQAGKSEHLLSATEIPVVQTDRGGQVTYHGPGQLVVYPLLDLKRSKIGVRELVTHIENSVINALAEYDIDSAARPDAPGVYVEGQKIASLGLRVKRGCSFHGVAINVDVDLAPFQAINPCGYAGLQMTSLALLAERNGTEAPSFDTFRHTYLAALTSILQLSPEYD